MRRSEAQAGSPVWDLPVRLFHWSIVLLIAASWWSSEYNADRVHFWSGYLLLSLLLFRIIWGFAGSSTARFRSFVRGPAAVIAYLREGQPREAGHDPLGGLSVVAMLLALIVQVATGLVQVDEDDFSEGPLAGQVSYELAVLAHDVHAASFNVLLALIALHLVAIGYYRFVRGRALVWPMVTGQAELPEGVAQMRPATRARFAACAAAALVLAVAIVAGVPALGS